MSITFSNNQVTVRELACIAEGWEPNAVGLTEHAVWTLLLDHHYDVEPLDNFPTSQDAIDWLAGHG